MTISDTTATRTAGSTGSFGEVESHGIEPIPAADRRGTPRELGFLWAGAFVNYASLFTASLLTTYYGLGVWDGLIATVLGTVAAAAILGLLSNTGPRTGLPQIVYTRGIFGLRGSYLGAALTLFLAVGWFRNEPWFRRRIAIPGSLAIAAVGLFWAVQRIIHYNIGIS